MSQTSLANVIFHTTKRKAKKGTVFVTIGNNSLEHHE